MWICGGGGGERMGYACKKRLGHVVMRADRDATAIIMKGGKVEEMVCAIGGKGLRKGVKECKKRRRSAKEEIECKNGERIAKRGKRSANRGDILQKGERIAKRGKRSANRGDRLQKWESIAKG